MNYSNITECANYILIRLHMVLRHNLKEFDTLLFKNKATNEYSIHVIVYKNKNKYNFKINLLTIITKEKIEDLLISLLNKINDKIMS